MVDVDSDKAGAKQLLNKSKAEPVSFAAAIGEDGKSAVMLLDKMKAPRALLGQLQKDHPKASKPVFGTAQVDEEKDPKLVRLQVNKASSGLARRLVKTLKGTGFNKVELMLEDGSLAESSGGEDEEDAGETQAEEQPAVAVAPPPPPAPPPPAPPQAKHDAGQLARALKALVTQVAAVHEPEQRTSLLKLANEAQGHLKADELAEAEQSIVALNRALAGAAKPGGNTGGSPARKLQPVWQNAKESIDGKLEQLARELRALDDEDANQVAEFGLFGLTSGGETVKLMKALAEYDGADAGKRPQAGAALREAASTYRTQLDANPVAGMLDDNPFGIELGLRETLGGALQEIESALA